MTIFGVTFWQALPFFVIGWVFGVTSLWRYRPSCYRQHVDDGPDRLDDPGMERWSSESTSGWTDRKH